MVRDSFACNCLLHLHIRDKKGPADRLLGCCLAGLTVFGMDFINETWNGWVFHLTQRSALWTAPGDTAFRTMVGWNIEIMFMFAISGIIYYYTLLDDKEDKILGIPNRWFWAIGYSVFCVFVECLLNAGGHLVWEYPWWHRSFKGVWLIFLFGYFHFYVAALLVIGMKTIREQGDCHQFTVWHSDHCQWGGHGTAWVEILSCGGFKF